jgi:ABC-2 type transport system permease protein
VLGKWTARMGLGLVQIGVGVAIGTALFKMNWGTALPMVAVVLLAWAAFNASLALLMGNLARNANQMAGLGVLGTMILAALGGCWWPIEVAPAWMQTLAMGLPTGWCMDALHKLVSFGDPSVRTVPHVVALLAAAIVTGWAGIRTFRYQ